MRLYAGTSGYSYSEWKGSFYPDKLPAKDMLRHYAERLRAVEINNTFYRMPKSAVMERWAEDVPDGFRFVIKASRRITHYAKLAEPDELLGYLWGSIQKLGDRLGPVLFQLPKWLKKDAELLRGFLTAMSGTYRAAFDFQHRTWFDDDVYEVLRDHDATIVINDASDRSGESPPSTANWGYVRLRRADYTEASLSDWAGKLREREWDEAFVFFKHEGDGAGPELASRFQAMVD